MRSMQYLKKTIPDNTKCVLCHDSFLSSTKTCSPMISVTLASEQIINQQLIGNRHQIMLILFYTKNAEHGDEYIFL